MMPMKMASSCGYCYPIRLMISNNKRNMSRIGVPVASRSMMTTMTTKGNASSGGVISFSSSESASTTRLLFRRRQRNLFNSTPSSTIVSQTTSTHQNGFLLRRQMIMRIKLKQQHSNSFLSALSSSYSPLQSSSLPLFSSPLLSPFRLNFSTSTSQQQQQQQQQEDEGIIIDRPIWLQKMDSQVESNNSMDSQKVYRYLKLEKYTKEELENRFQSIALINEGIIIKEEKEKEDSEDGDDDKEEVFIDENKVRSYIMQTIRDAEAGGVKSTTGTSTTKSTTDFLRNEYVNAETKQLWNFLIQPHQQREDDNDSSTSNTTTNIIIEKKEFIHHLTETATSIDKKRLWPLTLSMVMIGLSVGVTTPAFPFVIQNLGLSVQEYGLVVSAFALTKLFGNIPFAVLVEQHGRKPYLVYSMIAIATGVGCIGLSTGFNDLFACRLITGLGVAGLSCAATMTVTDISTPLNRASSYAPIAAGFAAGTAMGPALGGILIDYIGVNPTFYLVGGSFLLLGGINSILLDETMSKPWGSNSRYKFPWHQHQQQLKSGSGSGEDSSSTSETDDDDDNNSIKQAFHDALGQWKPLLSVPTVRNVCIMNGFYWVALAGSQMTLLPLILTDPSGLAFTATQVGQVYMGMSLVQVLGNPIFARMVDKVGTVPGIVGGCSLISLSMYTLPLCDPNHIEQMACVLGAWAAGSSLLSSSPIAHISNHIDDSKRAQAIALLRTSGDVGFLIGASTMGLLSDWAGGLDVAMQSSSAILATATSWYIVRNVLSSRMKNNQNN
jgi:MFS family permease